MVEDVIGGSFHRPDVSKQQKALFCEGFFCFPGSSWENSESEDITRIRENKRKIDENIEIIIIKHCFQSDSTKFDGAIPLFSLPEIAIL